MACASSSTCQSVPRRLVRGEGLQAFFGASDEVIFSARERDQNFIYRISEDGSKSRMIVKASLLLGVSPDRKSVAVQKSGSSDTTSVHLLATVATALAELADAWKHAYSPPESQFRRSE